MHLLRWPSTKIDNYHSLWLNTMMHICLKCWLCRQIEQVDWLKWEQINCSIPIRLNHAQFGFRTSPNTFKNLLRSHLNPVVVAVAAAPTGTYEHQCCSCTNLSGTMIEWWPGVSNHANELLVIKYTSVFLWAELALNNVLICDNIWSIRPENSIMLITNSTCWTQIIV